MKKKQKSMIVVCIVAVVVIIAGILGGIFIYKKASEPKEAEPLKIEEEYKEIQEQVVDKGDDPYESKVNFEELQAMNPDIYAWITIPGTNVDYPILQSAVEADDYYLNTTMDKKVGLPGAIYTEKYNNTSFWDPVTVIYGHTLAEGTMFTELHNYTDKAFFDANPYIYIYLPDKALKYQIFSAVAFDDRYILGNYNFADPSDFDKYINELNASMTGNINTDLKVESGSNVITLSTCIDEFPDQRWLVNAVLLPDEE